MASKVNSKTKQGKQGKDPQIIAGPSQKQTIQSAYSGDDESENELRDQKQQPQKWQQEQQRLSQEWQQEQQRLQQECQQQKQLQQEWQKEQQRIQLEQQRLQQEWQQEQQRLPQEWQKQQQQQQQQWQQQQEKQLPELGFISKFQHELTAAIIILLAGMMVAMGFIIFRQDTIVIMLEKNIMTVCELEEKNLDDCMVEVFKKRERVEPPDITKHLANIKQEVKDDVKIEVKSNVNNILNSAKNELENNNKDKFDNLLSSSENKINAWKKDVDDKVDSSNYKKGVAEYVPKQFKTDEAEALRTLQNGFNDLINSQKIGELVDFFNKFLKQDYFSYKVDQLFNILEFSYDQHYYPKPISKNNKEKNGIAAALYMIKSEADGKFFEKTNADSIIKHGVERYSQETVSKLESLETMQYDIRARMDIQGGAGTIYLALVALAVVSLSSLFLSVHQKSMSSSSDAPISRRPPVIHDPVPSTSGQTAFTSADKILLQIELKKCEEEICVVSFYKDIRDTNRKILDSALIGTNLENTHIHEVLINIHHDIVDLPPCKVYVIFVGYNQTHLILENLGGCGDLRLTTVRAARKIGGETMVVYIGDTGSSDIPDGRLYSTRLASIYRHPDLKIMEQKNQVLSANQSLNDFQKQAVQSFVRRNITC